MVRGHVFFYNNNLINTHKFINHKSCRINLLGFLERVTHEQDNGNCINIIFLDFSLEKTSLTPFTRHRLLEKL